MNLDPRKYAIEEHKRWSGYLQPEGIVVSPAALVDHGVQLDASQLAPIQERLLSAIERDITSGAPIIASFPLFARAFLDWRDDLLDIFSVTAEVPEALTISTGDYGEMLRPDAAYRALSPDDPARPWQLLVRQLPLGTDFDKISDEDRNRNWVASPAQKFERLLRATEISIGVLCNGSEIRLLYAPRGENAGSLTFPVRFMTELPGRAVAAALEMLLSHRRLVLVSEASRLPSLLKKSREYQSSVSSKLAEQVLEALYELVRGFQEADSKTDNKLLHEVLARDPDEIYHALLSVLLRMVFLLFAEDRGLMPGGSLYQRNYSIHGMFERLRAANERYPDTMDSRLGAWAQLLTLCRLVYNGHNHPDLRMPARLGHLFDPDRFPFLEGREGARVDVRDPANQLPLVSDGTLYRVLDKLLILDGERLSYRTLDVEQIGSVYQTMIGFSLEVAKGASIALKPAKPKGAPAFLNLDAFLLIDKAKRAEHLQKLTDHKLTGQPAAILKSAQTVDDLLAALDRKIARQASSDRVPAGSLVLQPTDERRRSGSHYTPRALTAPIVRKTLEPILKQLGDEPTPQQILELKVCDPAVGSGAFLVEACRQLGDTLVTAWIHHGGKPIIPQDEDELLHARRLIAQRCLYGVDRNPMATDLAKLSLWLATLAKDHPFTFLDHSLRSGDALVGLSKKQIVAFHWDVDSAAAKERQFGQIELEKAIERATSYRREILEGGDYMLPALKAHRLALSDQELAKVRRAGDLCLAAFFGAEKPKARGLLRERYLELLLDIDPKNGFKPETVASIQAIVSDLRVESAHPVAPFHWEIEFPEVFGRQNGGFDAFIGNPPYAGGKRITTANGDAYLAWLLTMHQESGGNADLVAHFFRRAFTLNRSGGTFGLIATNTIRQGDTRYTGLRWICTRGRGTIYAARRRYRWVGAAAVVVSVVWVIKSDAEGPFELDGRSVKKITAYLFHDGGHENPALLEANSGKSFIGSFILGMGFTFDDTDKKGVATSLAEMRNLISNDPRNGERIFPYLGGEELNDSPSHLHHRFVINFENFPLGRADLKMTWLDADEEQRTIWTRSGIVPLDYPSPVANDWPDLIRIVENKVKPERMKKATEIRAYPWWRFWRNREELTDATRNLQQIIALSRHGEHGAFTMISPGPVFADSMVILAISEESVFALLQSRVHEAWARFFASSIKDDLRYTPSDCFETFPFPKEEAVVTKLTLAGHNYFKFRSELMLKLNQGMTDIYNRFHDPGEQDEAIRELRSLHSSMDHAVLEAYQWDDLIKMTDCEFFPDYYDEPEQPGGEPIARSIRYRWQDATRDEVLARLLKLNAARASEELAATSNLPAKEKKPKSTSKTKRPRKSQLGLGLETHSPIARLLPTDFRLAASQPLLYTTNLVIALISECGGSVPWDRLLIAYVLATDPQLMQRFSNADDKLRVKAWAARWNETVPSSLLIPSLNQLGGQNLTVSNDNNGRVFHLLDGPRTPANEDVGYDAWLALRVAADLTPNALNIPEYAAWTQAAQQMVLT